MKRILLSYCFILLILGSCNHVSEKTSTQIPAKKSEITTAIKNLNSQEAKNILTHQPEITILDVRTTPEFTGGHLQKAANLDYNGVDFSTQLADLDKTKPYLVYCAAGGRSSKAVKLMQEMGFQEIYNATEGFPELEKVGIPVSK